jgi:hypothetical protein
MAFWTKFHSTRSDLYTLLFVPCSLPELGLCLNYFFLDKRLGAVGDPLDGRQRGIPRTLDRDGVLLLRQQEGF